MTILGIVGGLALLVVGAELVVRGASRLALALGISPLIIGLTVVAFSTSAPEFAVSIGSALRGTSGIVVGNVVGSNIANVLLILGIAAIISPMIVSQNLIRLDVPLMIGVSVIAWLFASDGVIARYEGGLMFAGLIGYIWFAIRTSKTENQEVQQEYDQEFGEDPSSARQKWGLNLLLFGSGLGLLIFGADVLVDAAVGLARTFGVSELVIGLTIIAVGTSLPEVVTSIVAAIRKQADIAVGNVVGSNVFNLLGVLGLTAIIQPVAVNSAALNFDMPVMIATAVACLPVFFVRHLIARWEGIFFLGYYLAYVLYLILHATGHTALPVFSRVMLEFVVPLTVVTLVIYIYRHVRPNQAV